MPKVLFSRASFEEDLSYVAGVIWGDGHIHESNKIRKTPSHSIILSNTDLDFMNEFEKAVSRLIGPGTAKIRQFPESPYKSYYTYVRHSHWLYHLFNQELSEVMSDIHSPLQFLKGIFDSEGCITFHRKDNRLHKALTISTTTIDVKETVQQILEQNDIKYNICIQKTKKKKMKDGHWIIPNNHYCFYITIGTKQAIERFAEIMPRLISRKQTKLEQLLKEMAERGFTDLETGHKISSIQTRKKQSTARKKYWDNASSERRKKAAEQMSQTIKKWRKEQSALLR